MKTAIPLPTAGAKLNIFHMDFNYIALRKDYLRAWLRRLPALGFNAILWELEDKVQWETCPECVWPEALSKTEFKELLAETRALGLEPIPLLQTVGHAEYVLQHPPYHSFRELSDRHDCYCTSNAQVTTFLKAWIAEYLELFGDLRYFHLGGDEAYVFGKCPRCSADPTPQGRNKLFGNHIRALAEPLLKHHIRPGIWNDMIMADPGATGLSPRDFVIWDWNYWDTEQPPQRINLHALGQYSQATIATKGILNDFPNLVDSAGHLRPFGSVQILKKYGFEIFLCSSSRSYGDTFFCPRPLHAANIVGAAQTVAAENLLGHCVTSWAIRLNDYATQIPYLGLAARATAGQSSATLLADYCRELFGADPAKFIKAIHLLGVSLPFMQSGTSGVQWNTLKDSLPAPAGYLQQYLADLTKKYPSTPTSHQAALRQAVTDIPEGIKLLTEMFAEAKAGFDILDGWLTGARHQLATALIAQRIFTADNDPALPALLTQHKHEYAAYLRHREDARSAEKNAGLAYDALIDLFQARGKSNRHGTQ